MLPETNLQICQFIRDLGQQAKHLRAKGLEVSSKGIDDYVTQVDRLLDRKFTAQFQQWFPNDAIITEENPDSIKLWQQNHVRYWFIDPIDGTSDYIAGNDSYSVMVGLLEDGEPIMGWVYAPESDRLVFGGTLIDGLFLIEGEKQPERLNFCDPKVFSMQLILSDKDEAKYGSLVRTAIPGVTFYSIGSFGLKVIEVILGKADAYLYLNRRVKLWDTVAPLAFAKFAGLVYCDLEGSPLAFSASVIHPPTLAHLQDVLIGWSFFTQTYLPAIASVFESVLIPQVSQTLK
jgi:3'(2'), 5'-bisphosphate nucleotidase